VVTVLLVVVVVLSIFVAFDFFMTFAVMRRMRLEGVPRLGPTNVSLPQVGMRLPTFQAETLSGRLLSDGDLREQSVVIGFMALGCAPCQQLKDELLERRPNEKMVFFVQGALKRGKVAPESLELLQSLETLGEVLPLTVDSAIKSVFEIDGYPTLLRSDRGQIVQASYRLRDIVSSEPVRSVAFGA